MYKENLPDEEKNIKCCYPSDVLDSLKEAVAGNKNIHIHGEEGNGKSTLLRFLATKITDKHRIIYVPQDYDPDDIHEDLPQALFTPPGLDPWWSVLKRTPDAVIVDGDDTLKAVNGQADSAESLLDEDYVPYQHDGTLWDMTNRHIQVLSAGNRPVVEMNNHLREYGMGAYEMNYDLDVEIKKESQEDGTPWFNLAVDDVKYLHVNKPKGMRDLLKSISESRTEE